MFKWKVNFVSGPVYIGRLPYKIKNTGYRPVKKKRTTGTPLLKIKQFNFTTVFSKMRKLSCLLVMLAS